MSFVWIKSVYLFFRGVVVKCMRYFFCGRVFWILFGWFVVVGEFWYRKSIYWLVKFMEEFWSILIVWDNEFFSKVNFVWDRRGICEIKIYGFYWGCRRGCTVAWFFVEVGGEVVRSRGFYWGCRRRCTVLWFRVLY